MISYIRLFYAISPKTEHDPFNPELLVRECLNETVSPVISNERCTILATDTPIERCGRKSESAVRIVSPVSLVVSAFGSRTGKIRDLVSVESRA
ncbi:MAG TPA: hypothetical protein PK765_00670 [bacterium]|nr:hypothetical protein [bacterium]